jgi:glycosyltransferase involved in cell wall biosynthesis
MHADRGFRYPVGLLPYFLDRIDADWQQPAPPPQERPYFLFVGRLEEIKGLQTLIPLWDRVPSHDLLVVGGGAYGDALRSAAAANPRIKFLGVKSQAQLGALYAHATACIVPSLTYETFGIVIIEAFARRTPVIVRDLGALPEVVAESGGGLIYRTDDQLLEAVRRLAEQPDERDRLGRSGHDAFVKLWSRDAHLDLYFELLTSTARAKYGRVPWDDAGAVPLDQPAG